MTKGRVEIYQDNAGEWRFRVKGGNGEIVAGGEGYTRRSDAMRGYEDLKEIIESPETTVKVLT